MWITTQPTWIITGAWEGTELLENADLEGEDIAYIAGSQHRPSHRGSSVPVQAGCIAIYLGARRVTEWDGKGWSRPVRPMYLVDNTVVAAVSDFFRPA